MDMNHATLFHYQLFPLKNFCILPRIKEGAKGAKGFFGKKNGPKLPHYEEKKRLLIIFRE